MNRALSILSLAILFLCSCETGVVVLPSFITASDVLEIQPGNDQSFRFDNAVYRVTQAVVTDCECITDSDGDFCATTEVFSEEGTLEFEQFGGRITLTADSIGVASTQLGQVNLDGSFRIGALIPTRNFDTNQVVGDGFLIITGTITDSQVTAQATTRLTSTVESDLVDCQLVTRLVMEAE